MVKEQYEYKGRNPNNTGLSDRQLRILKEGKEQQEKELKDLFLCMQYYYEHIKLNGYITPENWYNNYKHF